MSDDTMQTEFPDEAQRRAVCESQWGQGDKMDLIELPERPKGLRFAQNRSLTHEFDIHAADGVTEINLYDEIGPFGVTASDMRRRLETVTNGTIRLNINSPGGNVFDGIAIYNDLLQHKARVEVNITGVAASAASVIAMAGDQIDIAESGFLMIHNAWGLFMGNKNDALEFAELLDTIDGAMARTYARRTGSSVDAIKALMDAETWMVGDEAVEAGFADGVTDADRVQALFDFSMFNETPASLRRDVEAGLREAGYSRKEARDAASAGFHCLTQREAGEGRSHQREADETSIAALIRQTNERIRGSFAA